ncbi:MAG: glycosyltransferase family protein [Flavobacteriales bacterium]
MVVGIIQARMSSTRLPGKVLLPVGDASLMAQCIRRLKKSKLVDHWILATSDEQVDQAIVEECQKIGIACYQGSEWDVLDRFYQAAIHSKKNIDTVVRICCDNPTHHGEVVDYTIEEFKRYGVDYFSNGNQPPHYAQDGITSEVFSFHSLESAWKESTLMSEREHVTPYIKTSGKFSCGWRKFDADYNFKLSVDTPQDMELAQIIFNNLGPDFPIKELISFLNANPNYLKLNEGSVYNEGYLKSLKEDKKVK